MVAVPPPVQILCRQCSAPLPVEQGTQFVTCEYCGTTNVVEKGQAVFHYLVNPTIRAEQAEAALRRWMAGNETIKGLDQAARIEQPVFQLFPMWLVRVSQNGQERLWLEPAAALSISELKNLSIPASDLLPYDPAYDDDAVEATVPYKAMMNWLKEEHHIASADIREVALVHLPIYLFKYNYKDRRYTALVDAASGEVFANIYPSKWEAPYVAIAAAAFATYFCAALIPLGGYLLGDGSGLGLGILIYAGALVVITIPFFIGASAISAKV